MSAVAKHEIQLEPLTIMYGSETERPEAYALEHGDSALLALKPDVQERDGHACVYCGFRSEQFQEIHHVDHDHSNNQIENLATICHYCHLLFHPSYAGKVENAKLIFEERLTQAQINHIIRGGIAISTYLHLSIQRIRKAGQMELVNAIKSQNDQYHVGLTKKIERAEEFYGTSSPHEMAQALANAPKDLVRDRHDRLKGLRLLPSNILAINGKNQAIKIYKQWLVEKGNGICYAHADGPIADC